MPLVPMPVVPVVRICKVRTYRDRFERLDWLACWAAGYCTHGGAW